MDSIFGCFFIRAGNILLLIIKLFHTKTEWLLYFDDQTKTASDFWWKSSIYVIYESLRTTTSTFAKFEKQQISLNIEVVWMYPNTKINIASFLHVVLFIRVRIFFIRKTEWCSFKEKNRKKEMKHQSSRRISTCIVL